MRQLFSKGVHPAVVDILRHIFLNPSIEELLPQTEILLELTIQCPPPAIQEQESISDKIKSHLELLVEELDALSFLKPLQDKHILTADEAQQMLEETPVSHKVIALCNLFALPTTSYKEIFDNMSPNQMMETCFIQLPTYNSAWRREFQAQHLLQYVLMQDTDTKLPLINSLRIYNQIPPEISFPQDVKEDLKSKNEEHNTKTHLKKKETCDQKKMFYFLGNALFI